MKILIVANNSGGLANFRGKLIEQLATVHEIVVATPLDIRVDVLKGLGARVFPLKMESRGVNPFKDIYLLNQIIKIVKEEKPDYILTYTVKPNIYGGMVARFGKIPYSTNITGLGTAFERKSALQSIVVLMYKMGLKGARNVFFENKANADLFERFGIAKKKQIHILHGAGVDLERFTYQVYPKNEAFQFLFVGRVMKEKGINEVFEAMKRLRDNGYACELNVLGRFEENYKEIIEKYQGEGWLKYYGVQEDVHPFFARADCFVLPSYHEGMANTNLECAATGRPIITSNIPGCKEAVIPDVSGFLCTPKNVDSLYDAMKCMIAMSNDERAKMGKAGRKHMEALFDKKKVVAETIQSLFDGNCSVHPE